MKKILALILAVMMCLALISCGESEPAETVAEENVMPAAYDFIGLTVGDAEEILGTNYTVSSWQGSDSLYYEDQPFILAVWLNYDESDNKPIQERIISSVEVTPGGNVTDKITVGMTKGEIDKILGESTEVYVNEGGSTQFGITVSMDDVDIMIDLDEEMVSQHALVKKK